MGSISSPNILSFPNFNYVEKIVEWYTLPRITQHFDKFISYCQSMTEAMSAIFPREQIAELPNGVPIDTFKPPSREEKSRVRARLSLPDNATVYIFVGRYISTKHVDTLVQSWKKWLEESETTDDKFLLTVGYDPQAPRSFSDPIHHVRDLGVLSEEGVIEALQASDFFAFPSVLEGMSLAMLEGMACGLPPLVSKSVSGMEMLDETNTIFIGDNDVQRLAEAVKTALINSYNLDLSARMNRAEAARKLVAQSYSMDQVADQYSALLRLPHFRLKTP